MWRGGKGTILEMELRAEALRVLCVAEPESKARQARALLAASRGGAYLDPEAVLAPEAPLPGRPARPGLVAAIQVPRRSPFTTEGRAALLHAICHIERICLVVPPGRRDDSAEDRIVLAQKSIGARLS